MGSAPKRNRKKSTADKGMQELLSATKVLDEEPDDQSQKNASRSASTTQSGDESLRKNSRSKKSNRKDRNRRSEFESQRVLQLRGSKISKVEEVTTTQKKGSDKFGRKGSSRHNPLNRKIGTRLGKRQQETPDDTQDFEDETLDSDQNEYPDAKIQKKLKKILKTIDPTQLTRIASAENGNRSNSTAHLQIKSALEQISQIISETLPLLNTFFISPASVKRDEQPLSKLQLNGSSVPNKPEPKVTRLSETATPVMSSKDRKSSVKAKRHQSVVAAAPDKRANGKSSVKYDKDKSTGKKVKNPLEQSIPLLGEVDDDQSYGKSDSSRQRSAKAGKGSAKQTHVKNSLRKEPLTSKIEEEDTESPPNKTKVTKMTRSVSASERTIRFAGNNIKQESTVVTINMPEEFMKRKGRGHVDFAQVLIGAPSKKRGINIGHDHKSDPKVGQAVERRLQRKITNLENPPTKLILRTGRKVDPSGGKSKTGDSGRQTTKQVANPLITAQTLASVNGTQFAQSGGAHLVDPRISQLETLNQSTPKHLLEETDDANNTSSQSSRSYQRNRKKKQKSKKKQPKQEYLEVQAELEDHEHELQVSPQREPEPPALLPLSHPTTSPRAQGSKSPIVLQKPTPSRPTPDQNLIPKSRHQSPYVTQTPPGAKPPSSKPSKGVTPTNRLSPSHHSHRDVPLGLRTPKQQSPSSRNIAQPVLKPQTPKSSEGRPSTKPTGASAQRSPNKTPNKQVSKDMEVRHLKLDIRQLGSQSDAEDDPTFKA